ncbi:MFS transporter [Stutzerimonas kunmingensis]|uniref:MFS transporter n=1 Tax=Stutzerimonas kunmingensis TaxID=1211807 RepID=UPI0028A6E271|nr:MFS transporter [Stutzerimonas kunmingensis]
MTSSYSSPALANSSGLLSPGLVLLLASGAGFSVATLYYSQPILGVLGAEIQASEGAVGMVPMLTQLGYAFGILLLAPLGDRYDRRGIILAKAVLLMLALLLGSIAPGVGTLLAASLVIGLAATLAQDIVPAAATLAPESQRGRVVGTVMTGLLLGILLSRVMSGLIAEQLGWRAVAFSAFWSTLAVMLHADFGLGSAAAGAFGLAGAAGALAAPLAGRLADRRGPERVTRLGAALTAASFAALGLVGVVPPEIQLGVIVVAAIGFDFGIQATLVAHQTIVYGIDPPARSRLNAVLFTGVFVGMATGAGLGSLALGQWGWNGVVVLATLASIGALAARLVRRVAP